MNFTKFVLFAEYSKNRNRTLLLLWLIEICVGTITYSYGAYVACIRVTAGCIPSNNGRQNFDVKYPTGLQTKYHLQVFFKTSVVVEFYAPYFCTFIVISFNISESFTGQSSQFLLHSLFLTFFSAGICDDPQTSSKWAWKENATDCL